MYSSYTLFQAGHVKTARQQREEDVLAGQLAAEFGRAWRSLAGRRDRGRRGFRPAPEIEMLSEARAGCSGLSAGTETVCR